MPKKTIDTATAGTTPAPRRRTAKSTTPKLSKKAFPNGSPTTTPRPSFDEIAEAAYLRFVSRGGTDGSDFDDWVAAERELLDRSQGTGSGAEQ